MKLPLAILISGALLAAAPVDAADRGFYLGAGAGQMNTEVNDVLGSGYKFDESDLGLKLFGGYKFFPWLSVEGAYIDGGSPSIKANYADGSQERLGIEVQSLVAAAVFALPIGDSFELFIKPGMAYWDSKTSYSYSSPDFSYHFNEDDNGAAFFLGAGAGINSGNFGFRIEYEWFDVAPEYDNSSGEFVDKLDASAGFFSASVLYMF